MTRKELDNEFRDRLGISETDSRNLGFRSCAAIAVLFNTALAWRRTHTPAERLHEVAERHDWTTHGLVDLASFCRVGIHLHEYQGGGKDRSEPLDRSPHWSRGDRGARAGSLVCVLAYVGPGAGFAFLGSFLTLIAGFFLSVFSLLLWPFRMAWRAVRRRKGYRHARVQKIVFLGLDGLDPRSDGAPDGGRQSCRIWRAWRPRAAIRGCAPRFRRSRRWRGPRSPPASARPSITSSIFWTAA
jgi:hypothetical protein